MFQRQVTTIFRTTSYTIQYFVNYMVAWLNVDAVLHRFYPVSVCTTKCTYNVRTFEYYESLPRKRSN